MSTRGRIEPRVYHPVGYTYEEEGKVIVWATVLVGNDEAFVLAQFRRQNPHVLSAWIIREEKEAA